MNSSADSAVEVLLFDMDGTIVDSTASAEGAWRRFGARHGIDPDSILAVSHGRPTVEVVARFAPDLDAAAEAARIEAEEINRTEGIVEIAGAGALLRSLDPDRWAVVTSASRALTEKRMATAGLPMPRVLVAADDVTAGKPDAQPYLRAAAALGADAAAAMVFEDAEAGLLSARAAGARPVVVGDYDGDAAAGLRRLPDLRAVRVRPDGSRLAVEFG